jgi:hypothetical protein
MAHKRIKPAEARIHLLEALAILEDPAKHCRDQGYAKLADEPGSRDAFTIGSVKSILKFALWNLGATIDPFK